MGPPGPRTSLAGSFTRKYWRGGARVRAATIGVMSTIERVELVVGMEVHVELSTRTKVFSAAPSPACAEFDGSAPNTCIDATVLGLPGALPVLNERAVEMSMMVGLALGCQIAATTRWDRKGYFYPDLPKGYQISQYDLPVCFDGVMDVRPAGRDGFSVGIIRAHLEEDAGKLLHEAPGGGAIDFSIADYNRAGTALLEIVSQPDIRSADDAVEYCRALRNLCRFLGVSRGVLQKGHMRFEPNINTVLTFSDGRVVRTPIVEVKNLNSFAAVRDSILYEFRDQPGRYLREGREMGPGTKQTRGWDAAGQCTVLQREKEDAHDYRYFPDPDLLPVVIERSWVERVRGSLPEMPMARVERTMREYGLGAKESLALADERAVAEFFDVSVEGAVSRGVERAVAGKQVANVLLQSGAKRANERSDELRRARADAEAQGLETAERGDAGAGDGAGAGEGVLISELGISPGQVGELVALRVAGQIGSNSVDELFGLMCAGGDAGGAGGEGSAGGVEALARARGMIVERDDKAIDGWVRAAIEEQPKAAEDVRAGKDAAIGRLVGAAMKHAGGKGDAKVLRERLLAVLRGGGGDA
jgi:aspartyl-tRNA(Asn)/glutamyl-tRNA(Gln) amidotransferase subunit B